MQIGDYVTHKNGKKGKIISIKNDVIRIKFETDLTPSGFNIENIHNSIIEYAIEKKQNEEKEKLLQREKNKQAIFLQEEKLKKEKQILKNVNQLNEEEIKNILDKNSLEVNKFINDKLDYLCAIKKEFENKRCIKRECDFTSGFPEYENDEIQNMYMCNYFAAYFITYYYLYALVKYIDFLDEKNWEILSIGSGNSIDGKAASFVNKLNDYVGIDKVIWKDNLFDNTKLINKDIKNIDFSDIKNDPNIIIFPKSITEFSQIDFEKFIRNLGKKVAKNDKLIVIFAYITEKELNYSEITNSRFVEEEFSKYYNKVFEMNSKKDSFLSERKTIFKFVKDFWHMGENMPVLNCEKKCDDITCARKKSPMVYTNFFNYKIIGLERKK